MPPTALRNCCGLRAALLAIFASGMSMCFIFALLAEARTNVPRSLKNCLCLLATSSCPLLFEPAQHEADPI